MVNPIHIISISLGLAFAIGLFNNLNKHFSGFLMMAGLISITFISGEWLLGFFNENYQTTLIFTAGYKPPVSISLAMGFQEAAITSLINLMALINGFYLYKKLAGIGKNAMIIYLVAVMAMNVMIMTRDIFNLFVFLEVESIAIAGLVLLNKDKLSVSAGFKYMMASGVIAGLLLIGIAFVYNFSGTLYLNDILTIDWIGMKAGSIVLFLLFIAFLLELKPFPANGWALDLYQSVHPGIASFMSSVSASTAIFVFYKVSPMLDQNWLNVMAIFGMASFIGSNFLGISQKNTQRLLGYSSIGQIGLIITVISLKNFIGPQYLLIALSILFTHAFAKAGLFWLKGILSAENIENWQGLRKKPVFIFMFAIAIFALLGFPPFPSFFGKWNLIMELFSGNASIWAILILTGSLLEAVYLLRWFGKAMDFNEAFKHNTMIISHKTIPVYISTLILLAGSYFFYTQFPAWGKINMIHLGIIFLMFFIEFIPGWIKNLIAILLIAYFSYDIYPLIANDPVRLLFSGIFLIGSILTLIPGFAVKGKQTGYYPLMLFTIFGLIQLVIAKTTLQFFFAWEIMALGSYLLITRGKNAYKSGYLYIIFSLVGAYLIFLGFGYHYGGELSYYIANISHLSSNAFYILVLLSLGFLIKAAVAGFHLWIPGAYAEAENHTTPFLSGILSKSGVFGLLITFLAFHLTLEQYNTYWIILGWLGAITAFTGNIVAVFQEDVKRLVAYASMGAMGYIIFSLSLMNHTGWLTTYTYTLNHFLYKTLIFIAIAGVLHRVKSRKIYEMGGLIKQMPFSFIAILIGIITLAGIPPLSGFAGKWLFYNAVIYKGWYLQGTLVFFSGIIAFLYCFKLISSIFLGQPKDHLRNVKEAPAWYIIPQLILIGGIMFFSFQPAFILKPLGSMLSTTFDQNIVSWDNSKAFTSIGYWDAWNIGLIVMGMFAILFAWLFINSRKAKKIKQFDIVFASERPFKPETTHVSYNMFAGYNKAIGFLAHPFSRKFWNTAANWYQDISDHIKQIYNGNGQTYVIHIFLYMILFFIFIN